MRLVPPLEHLLLDHLLSRGESAFESKEHIYSFLLGWHECIHPDDDKASYIYHCLSEAQRSGHDLHWHALDREVSEAIVKLSALLSGVDVKDVTIYDTTTPQLTTFGELIMVYTITRSQDAYGDYVRSIFPEVRQFMAKVGAISGALSVLTMRD